MKTLLPLAAVSVLIGVTAASYPVRSIALPDCQAIYEQCLADGVNPATCASEFEQCEKIGHGRVSMDHRDVSTKHRDSH
jgi:hypothetical protein